MAQSYSDAFTIGGLDRARMDGTILVAMRGHIGRFSDGANSIYNINENGGKAISGNASQRKNINLTFGAGRVTIVSVDLDGTGTTEGAGVELKFTFGKEEILNPVEGGIELIGAIANAGWSGVESPLTGHGVSPPDNGAPAPVGLVSIAGNSVTIRVGMPYEPEGGTQLDIINGMLCHFNVIGIAKGRIVGV